MKFLIDNALPPKLAEILTAHGYDAVHVRSLGLGAASDAAILLAAVQENRVVISADSDFASLLASTDASQPSFILFRDPNFLLAHDFASTLLPVLPSIRDDLLNGCVVVFRSGRLRVRSLPLRG